MRKIAIAIAVAGSVPPKYLGGAINGARAFVDWARRQDYETLLVTDEDDDVTMGDLRTKIETLLQASGDPIHRIIVYFAGHGLIRELEEGLWLLSDWRAELRAVAVEVLKRRLTMYGPRQLCIISDACRSLPSDIEQADLVPDAVLGAGPRPVDGTVAIDKFVAAQDGAEAFMIPGADPDDDRCLFSGVLVEGLWGLSGIQEKPFSKLQPDRITSRSLGAYLQVEVPARAKDYDLTLTPTISPTFPEGDDYYFSKTPPITPPVFPPWPPKGKLGRMGTAPLPKPAAKNRRTRRSGFPMGGSSLGFQSRLTDSNLGIGLEILDEGGDDFADYAFGGSGGGDDEPPVSAEPLPSPMRPALSEQLRSGSLPSGSDVSSGLSVIGHDAPRLWLQQGPLADAIGPGSWSIKDQGSYTLAEPAAALVEFSDGRFAATVALRDFFGSLVRDEYGVTGLVYRDLHMPRKSDAPVEEALDALESGALRGEAATDLAVKLREWKHADPVLGVISAYLYDAIGDVDSIRRMASFYARYGEAIPYDLALLGGLSGTRTGQAFTVQVPEVMAREPRTQEESKKSWTHCAMPACVGVVGGLWPWMRQGWIFLDDPSDAGSPLILPGLTELRSSLMRSRFATFEKDAALQLASLCGLHPI
ncbi:MAG: hypothetical protein ACJ798_08100 [Phenylobacterium sp.]